MSILPIPTGVDPETLHPATRALFARPQWAQRTPAWYEVRKGLMTASDAACALGIKPFASYKGDPRADLLQKKLDNAPVQGMALVHGVKYEDEARDLAMERLGDTAFDFGLLVHPVHTWLAASPDGITASGLCVEIKCPLRRKITDEIPSHYVPQVQIQMEVCDMEETVFCEYLPPHISPDGKPFLDIKRIKRDREWFAAALPKLHAFWAELMERRKTHAPQHIEPLSCLVDDELYRSECAEPAEPYARSVWRKSSEDIPQDVCALVDDLYAM